MKRDFEIGRRKSIRLAEYDYASPGAYFVTICTHHKGGVFGEVVNGRVILSPVGKIAESCWREIPEHFGHVELDYWITMPDHLHGILTIDEPGSGTTDRRRRRGVQLNAPTSTNIYSQISPKKRTLSVVIRTYKAAVTRHCRLDDYGDFKWQRSFYDRVIRDEEELNRIREYIIYNPVKWQNDSHEEVMNHGKNI